jgi:N-acyl-D-aspartate/D-glutamate deacylase
MVDLVIRGATVVDGLGSEPKRADVAVKDGRIDAIGAVSGKGNETIDADGLVLSSARRRTRTTTRRSPGTILASPSLGVTTAVIS